MFATAAPPVISAVCERQLTSRLFSPHSTTRPTTECAWARRSFVVAFSCSCQRTAFWMRETAAARPVLACRGLLSGNMLREGSQAPCRRRRPFSFDASTRTRTLKLTYAHARAQVDPHTRSLARTHARTRSYYLPGVSDTWSTRRREFRPCATSTATAAAGYTERKHAVPSASSALE